MTDGFPVKGEKELTISEEMENRQYLDRKKKKKKDIENVRCSWDYFNTKVILH